MKLIVFIFVLFIGLSASAQSYRDLTDKAIESIEKDSFALAEDLLVQAMRLEPSNPHNAMLFSNLGLVQRRLGRYEDALQSYTYALNIAPKAVPILLDRAALYMEKGMTDRAYIDYCEALDVDKVNKEALLMRAYIYVIRRDYKTARMDYDRLLEIDPQSYSGRLGLATLDQKEGKLGEALELINKLLIENQEDATLYVARADVEREMGHIELALVDLDNAVRLSPSMVDAYLLRGDIYLIQKKKTLARSDFEKAISLGIPQADLYEKLKLCR